MNKEYIKSSYPYACEVNYISGSVISLGGGTGGGGSSGDDSLKVIDVDKYVYQGVKLEPFQYFLLDVLMDISIEISNLKDEFQNKNKFDQS